MKRNFRYHNLPLPAPKIFDMPFAPQPKRTAAAKIGLRHRFRGFYDHAAGGEIRAFYIGQKRIVSGVWCFDQMQAGITKFDNIVRRNIGRHANRDAA